MNLIQRQQIGSLTNLFPFDSSTEHPKGPIIAVQVENEYGSYGNDGQYLAYLRDGLVRRGIEVPLFTSDGATDWMLQGAHFLMYL